MDQTLVRRLLRIRTRVNCVCAIGLIAGLPMGLQTSDAATYDSSIKIDIVQAISRDKVAPTITGKGGMTSKYLQMAASRGEFESASFIVYSSIERPSKLSLTSSALRHQVTGAELSSSAIDIRWVKRWYQSIYGWNEIGKSSPEDFRQVLLPELLLKDDSLVRVERQGQRNYVRLQGVGGDEYRLVNPKALAPGERTLTTVNEFPVRDSAALVPAELSPGEVKQVWVTIAVPESAEAGDYVGRLQISLDGRTLGFLEIHLTVHSFALAKSRMLYSIYYRGKLEDGISTIGSEYKSTKQMRQELLDIKAHGISYPTMYQASTGSEKLLAAALDLRRDLGMNRGPIFYLGIETTANSLGKLGPVAEQNLRRVLPPLVAQFREAGFSDVYIYGKDEARGLELTNQRRLWEICHDMGAKVFVAGYSGSHQAVGDLLDILVHAYQPDPKEAIKWKQGGKKILNYGNPQTGPENPYLFRLNYGLVLWAAGYDGAMPYAYQHCFASCWSDIDHPVYRDHVLAYPTADGVIPTLAWEGLREGIDDVRYLTTLEDAISGKNGSDAAKTASVYLAALRGEVRSRQGRFGKYNQNLLLDLDAIRTQVARYITSIVAESA